MPLKLRSVFMGVAFVLGAQVLHGQTIVTVDRPPELKAVRARYYPKAQRKEAGRVQLTFIVDTSGRVDSASISVVQASDPAFIDAAILTALAGEYRPGIALGQAVRVQVMQTITFTPGAVNCGVVITTLLEPQCADSTTRRWP